MKSVNKVIEFQGLTAEIIISDMPTEEFANDRLYLFKLFKHYNINVKKIYKDINVALT